MCRLFFLESVVSGKTGESFDAAEFHKIHFLPRLNRNHSDPILNAEEMFMFQLLFGVSLTGIYFNIYQNASLWKEYCINVLADKREQYNYLDALETRVFIPIIYRLFVTMPPTLIQNKLRIMERNVNRHQSPELRLPNNDYTYITKYFSPQIVDSSECIENAQHRRRSHSSMSSTYNGFLSAFLRFIKVFLESENTLAILLNCSRKFTQCVDYFFRIRSEWQYR